MLDLFGAEGLGALARIANERTLYAFDFDGTLAPIVTQPKDAHAPATTVALLTALGRFVPTLLLTGRGVDDLRTRIDFAPTFLIGNHGAEGMPAPLADPALAAHRAVVDDWLAQWPQALAVADEHIVLEPKRYSLSIHYRGAPDQENAQRAIAAALARLAPQPRVIGGKCVYNLLPAGAPDKGVALRALVAHAGCDAAFFIGDDVTDEAAFIDAPASWVTVRVGENADSAARFFISDQAAIDGCLRRLLENAEHVAQKAC